MIGPSNSAAASCATVDDDRFEQLLSAHQEPILLYLRSLVSDHHDAQDLLQKTNLILWRKRDQFVPDTNFRSWALRIARLEALNQVRLQRRSRLVLFERDEFENIADPDVAEEPADPAPLLALRDCLRRLPDRDRELLLMRYATEHTLNDYAKTLGRSPGTLKARLYKIREGLRKSIEDRLRDREHFLGQEAGMVS
ncbi:RNA polymerase sigma factor [Luteolibacter marinus]|uniref:RNA polymerase sigma factor n=1 Tax=Luteolibacter marinus TaxID=2776705 RepID=UPI00186749A9|nr:sigma-70 family RNA polymerase sigma factor [Luteolibacter marinus]